MHAINWFEIPALDLERAFQFYYAVLNGNVRKGTFGTGDLILFNVLFSTGEAVGGSIVVRSDLKPSTEGVLIYLNAFGKLSDKWHLFSQIELINALPTDKIANYNFTQRLRLGLKKSDWQFGLGGDFSAVGRDNFTNAQNIGIFLRHEF
jgi:hypothetical protein